MALIAHDTQRAKGAMPGDERRAEHGMLVVDRVGPAMQEAVLVGAHAIDLHARLAGAHHAAGAAAPNRRAGRHHRRRVEAVAGDRAQALRGGIERKEHRAVRARELHRLRGDHAQYVVEHERGGDQRRNAVQGAELVNLAPQLLIGLLVDLAVLDVHGELAGDDFEKGDLILAEIVRLVRLDADDPLQLEDGEEDDRHREQPAVRRGVGARLLIEAGIGESVGDDEGMAVFRHPARVALAELQRRVPARPRIGAARRAQLELARDVVEEIDGTEVRRHLGRDGFRRGGQRLIQIERRVGGGVDALERIEPRDAATGALTEIRCLAQPDGLIRLRQGHDDARHQRSQERLRRGE